MRYHPSQTLLSKIMADVDYDAILEMLRSPEETNHEIALQILASVGPISHVGLAHVLSQTPAYLFRSFENEWKVLLELIRKIEYRYQNIPELPQNIHWMKQLEVLSLSHCTLNSIPAQIGELHQLEKLILNYNVLKEIPKEIAQLKHLKELSLVGNALEIFPAIIGELEQLEILSLIDNQIKVIPRSIARLYNIKKLILRSNQLTDLPIELGFLENLETLDLAENNITRLPGSIAALQKLNILYLQNNPISKREKQKISHTLQDTIIYF